MMCGKIEKKQRSRDDPKEKKKRKPVYLKDRKTSSGVTFWVQLSFLFYCKSERKRTGIVRSDPRQQSVDSERKEDKK